VPLDCNPETLNVSPEILRGKAKNLKGLFLTNVLGFSDDIEEIKKICLTNKIVFIEDNCESLGSKVGTTLLGNFGLASTFSFFVGHHMSTIEGGMICTDDEELNRALVMARAHGWDRNLDPKDANKLRDKNGVDEFYSRYTFYDLAYNARPNEITGFLGNQQMQYFDEIVAKRQENFKHFYKAVLKNSDFVKYNFSHMNTVSNFAMPIICKDKKTSELYKRKFEDAKVEIRPVIAGNMTRQPFYNKYTKQKYQCPASDMIHANGFYFGNNAEMADYEIKALVKLLENNG
jgi:CDP-6-deoxy-D-xylo-4-hexulose-3-dehydrase